MNSVGGIQPDDFAHQLAEPGVWLSVGPLVVHVRSPHRPLAAAIHLLYAHHAMLADQSLADFHIRIDQANGPLGLRWLTRRQQAMFTLDGRCPFNPMPLRMALPLYEWGLNYCVASRAHQYLIIHAGVVERAGQALMLPGLPGSGKSTLTAALVLAGWRLLSDELALLRVKDGLVVPIPRPISLKNQSIDLIRQRMPDAVLGPACTDTAKGTVAHLRPPVDSVTQAHVPACLRWVVFPAYQPDQPVQWCPLPGPQAALQVADNAFNYSVLGRQGFEVLTRVMRQARAYRCSYHNLEQALDMLANELDVPDVSPAEGL